MTSPLKLNLAGPSAVCAVLAPLLALGCTLSSQSLTGGQEDTTGGVNSTGTKDVDTDGTGGTTTGGDDEDVFDGQCVKNSSVLSSLDVMSITGQTAADVLAQAEGEYSGIIRYVDSGIVSHKNVGTDSNVTVELLYGGGELRDLDAVLVAPCGHEGPCPCNDSLEIDVTLKITSEDGAIAETLPVVLTSTPSGDSFFFTPYPYVYQYYDPDVSPGGLQSSDLEVNDGTLKQVVITGTFSDGGMTGELNAEVDLFGATGLGPFAELAAVTELSDAACGVIRDNACELAGCATAQMRDVYSNGEECECDSSRDHCVASGGDGAATELWARIDPYTGEYEVVAFDAVAEPLGEPWTPCSELPEVALCQCFAGMNACP